MEGRSSRRGAKGCALFSVPNGVLRRLKAILPWAIWVGLLGAGSLGLASYGGAPGEVGTTPDRWPAELLPKSAAGSTIVLMLHPRCSCSLATLTEFERLLGSVQTSALTHAVFFVPEGADESWAQGALWDRVAAMGDTTPHADSGGAIAEAFGGLTSGHIAIYGDDGRLRFSGGLTSSRGHEGLSDGGVLAREALGGVARSSAPAGSHVYGCPIQDVQETHE